MPSPTTLLVLPCELETTATNVHRNSAHVMRVPLARIADQQHVFNTLLTAHWLECDQVLICAPRGSEQADSLSRQIGAMREHYGERITFGVLPRDPGEFLDLDTAIDSRGGIEIDTRSSNYREEDFGAESRSGHARLALRTPGGPALLYYTPPRETEMPTMGDDLAKITAEQRFMYMRSLYLSDLEYYRGINDGRPVVRYARILRGSYGGEGCEFIDAVDSRLDDTFRALFRPDRVAGTLRGLFEDRQTGRYFDQEHMVLEVSCPDARGQHRVIDPVHDQARLECIARAEMIAERVVLMRMAIHEIESPTDTSFDPSLDRISQQTIESALALPSIAGTEPRGQVRRLRDILSTERENWESGTSGPPRERCFTDAEVDLMICEGWFDADQEQKPLATFARGNLTWRLEATPPVHKIFLPGGLGTLNRTQVIDVALALHIDITNLEEQVIRQRIEEEIGVRTRTRKGR